MCCHVKDLLPILIIVVSCITWGQNYECCLQGCVFLQRGSIVLMSFLKRSWFTSIGMSKLHTRASLCSKVTYILKSNAKLVILLENLVQLWIPCICNVKYLSEKRISVFIQIFGVLFIESKNWAIHNVNSLICIIDAGPLIFPVPSCMQPSSAQLKAVRNPPQQERGRGCEQSIFSINSQCMSPYLRRWNHLAW